MPEEIDYTEFPPKVRVLHDLKRLIDRGMHLLYIYTGGLSQYYNYEHQFQDMFSTLNLQENVKVEYLSHIDHTFILEKDRMQLIKVISQWIEDQFQTRADGHR